MNNKYKRNTFKISELQKVAEAMEADLKITFVDKEKKIRLYKNFLLNKYNIDKIYKTCELILSFYFPPSKGTSSIEQNSFIFHHVSI